MATYMGQFRLIKAVQLSCAFGSSGPRLSHLITKTNKTYHFLARGYVRGVRRTPVKVFKHDELSDARNVQNARESISQQPTHDHDDYRSPRPDVIKLHSFKSFSETEERGVQSSRQPKLNKVGTRLDTEKHTTPDSSKTIPRDVDDDDDTDSIATNTSSQRIKYEKAYADDKRLGKIMTLLKSRKTRQKTGKLILEGRRLLEDALQSGAEAEMIFFSRLEILQELPLHLTDAQLIKVPFREIGAWSDLVTPYGVIGIFKQPKYSYPKVTPDEDPASSLPLTLICDNIRDPGNMGTILRSAVAAHCDKILITKGCVDIWESKVLRAGAGAHFHAPVLNNLTWKDITNFIDQSETTFHIADNNISKASTVEIFDTRDESTDITLNDSSTPHRLDTKVYYDIDWKRPSALIIGGETHGISSEALGLCDDTYGYRVYIPMSQCVESLNNAMSASIILFEAQRQMLEGKKNSVSS
ncbi:rRNA methyltransferase 3, mitochondrial-like [Amphiura filiformis]|uniref:rRNA methyltransferase 3, mitochondrial-like n=1 Tax=Amphiura filiformis TaxID=82378 RepID=UPI003B213E6A